MVGWLFWALCVVFAATLVPIRLVLWWQLVAVHRIAAALPPPPAAFVASAASRPQRSEDGDTAPAPAVSVGAPAGVGSEAPTW